MLLNCENVSLRLITKQTLNLLHTNIWMYENKST